MDLAPFEPNSPLCGKCYKRYHNIIHGPTQGNSEPGPSHNVPSTLDQEIALSAACANSTNLVSRNPLLDDNIPAAPAQILPQMVPQSPEQPTIRPRLDWRPLQEVPLLPQLATPPQLARVSPQRPQMATTSAQQASPRIVQIPPEIQVPNTPANISPLANFQAEAQGLVAENVNHVVPQNEMQVVQRPRVYVCPISERNCSVCRAPTKNRIPNSARAQAWSIRNVMIPINNRICQGHYDERGLLLVESLHTLANRCILKEVDCCELNKYLSDCVQTAFRMYSSSLEQCNPRCSVLNSESDCVCFTSLSRNDFMDFCNQIRIIDMRDDTKLNAIALFLAKIRMGNSQDQIGHFFGYSQSLVSRYMDHVSEAIDQQFVPQHLGYAHITRDEYVNLHQNSMIRILHEIIPGAAGVLIDGTYFEVEKSTNFGFQKVSYSIQKHYNLVKFVFVVAPDGYILDVFGPTGSDGMHNDASLFSRMLADLEGFRRFFQPNDVIIVNRGFRDSIEACEQLEMRIEMPPFLNGRRQLTREEADKGRFVTKVRWVIESVNGRLKNVFGFFRNQIPNKYIRHLGRYVRIASAILNRYSRPICPDRQEQIEIATYMVQRSRAAAQFQEEIAGVSLHTANYLLTEAGNIRDFPHLSEQDLRDMTVGVYQINNASSYTALHLERTRQDPHLGVNFQVYAHRQYRGLILVKMESRHVQSKIHNVLILYRPNEQGPNAIHGYYCSCQVGTRMVGMCCHTAAVVWLLAYAIPNNLYQPPAANIAQGLVNLRT